MNPNQEKTHVHRALLCILDYTSSLSLSALPLNSTQHYSFIQFHRSHHFFFGIECISSTSDRTVGKIGANLEFL
ncbi:hypothetical protein L3X38_040567 [Prunus dulcis]|uniref:Uncharacterized protein n=1 Tax=Prunus dulcis TaxID=3755 RepID=A0AAD4YTM2_PRUDU|nr:hypothetical protein L3X38_040567 [Prunus dulcis]